MNYNTADIRQFLTEAFSDEELSTLCFDFFRDVYDNFSAGLTKRQKVHLLIEHCQRREAIPNLLAAIQRMRPEQYEKRFPQAPQTAVPPVSPKPQRDPRQVSISHATADAEFAHRLASDLERRGWGVWIAPESIRPGEKWLAAINRGLSESDVFVLVLSPAAVKSPWVNDEVSAAIELKQRGVLRFLPLNVEPCNVPPMWNVYQQVSFRGRYDVGLTKLFAELEREKREREAGEKAAKEESARQAREEAAQREAEQQAKLAAEKVEAIRTAQEAERLERERAKAAQEQTAKRITDLSSQLAQAESRSEWDTVIELGQHILKLHPDHQLIRAGIALSVRILAARRVPGRPPT